MTSLGKRDTFAAIEGVRVILSAFVVSLHCLGLVTFASAGQGNPVGLADALFRSVIAGSIKWFMAQVDVFFLISGFLLSYSLLTDGDDCTSLISCCMKILSISSKKFLRLWPGVFFVSVAMYLLKDIGTRPFLSLLVNSVIMNSDELTSPINLIVLWSNKVELLASSTLALTVVILKKPLLGSYGFAISMIIALLSLVPAVISTLYLCPVTSRDLSMRSQRFIPQYMSIERSEWLSRTYGLSGLPMVESDPIRALWASYFYMNPFNRWSPFFLGLVMAVSFAKKENSSTRLSILSRIFHGAALLFATFGLFLPLLIATSFDTKNSSTVLSDDFYLKRATGIDVFVQVLMRPLIVSGAGYWMLRIILPRDHPLSFSRLAECFSWSWLLTIAPFTYSIYLVHFRILCELIFRVFSVKFFDTWLDPFYSRVTLIFTVSIIGYAVSFVVAYLFANALQKPVYSALSAVLLKPLESLRIGKIKKQ
jgi:peptidoglycan/LPS O-acetylase OafA/YrhL